MPLRYQEVKREIIRTISGLKAGSKIPSRNFLSRKFEVARNTIDKAVSELEEEGYLRSVKGSGTYISGRRLQKMLNVGGILPSIMGDIYPQFISGIEQFASAHNINVVLSSSDNSPERQRSNVLRMIDMQADGCIIIPIINSEQSFDSFLQLKKRNVPFVICYRSIDGLDVPFIGVNNYYGAFMAARHLIDQGCRKLSYFSQRKYSTAIERYYGYETALRSSPEKVEKKEIILGNYGEEELRERIKFILDREDYPDGVLCFDDTTATVLYAILQERGLQPGMNVKIVGNDDSNLCNRLSVPLSSVSPRAVEMGKEGITMLKGMIDGENSEELFHLIHPKLIVRKSSIGTAAWDNLLCVKNIKMQNEEN